MFMRKKRRIVIKSDAMGLVGSKVPQCFDAGL
jgi:hypothetical protein